MFTWFGGVLTQSIAELTMSELYPGDAPWGNRPERLGVCALAEELALGMIGASDYCRRAVKAGGRRLSAVELERRLLERGSLREPVKDLLLRIPGELSLWLVSDYPLAWYESVARRVGLETLFPAERLIVTSELGLKSMVPDIFYAIARCVGQSVQDCIVLDGQSTRAVRAVGHGLSSIIYAYPEHLERELTLRGILRTDNEVLHPRAAGRLNLQ